eukprot:TRINITY_DN497_c0_g1_i23.p1 TRINITY_DN497_c0_g1~~TRINITY_DN497_c0_g1_i23.p1  ORF type:complete len:805 (-),score=80.86 TRINITY_DN497_c0_g1_i23:97-2511(-)
MALTLLILASWAGFAYCNTIAYPGTITVPQVMHTGGGYYQYPHMPVMVPSVTPSLQLPAPGVSMGHIPMIPAANYMPQISYPVQGVASITSHTTSRVPKPRRVQPKKSSKKLKPKKKKSTSKKGKPSTKKLREKSITDEIDEIDYEKAPSDHQIVDDRIDYEKFDHIPTYNDYLPLASEVDRRDGYNFDPRYDFIENPTTAYVPSPHEITQYQQGPSNIHSSADHQTVLDYDPKYEPDYEPDYEPTYEPLYEPDYEPKYEPDYEPDYEPTYEPLYEPDYEPKYEPDYEPDYEPTYEPLYEPDYEPKYEPDYEPDYEPTYEPLYEPDYEPKYEPDYEPDYEPTYEPLYELDYEPKYQPQYEPTYESEYEPKYDAYEPKYDSYNPKYESYKYHNNEVRYKGSYQSKTPHQTTYKAPKPKETYKAKDNDVVPVDQSYTFMDKLNHVGKELHDMLHSKFQINFKFDLPKMFNKHRVGRFEGYDELPLYFVGENEAAIHGGYGFIENLYDDDYDKSRYSEQRQVEPSYDAKEIHETDSYSSPTNSKYEENEITSKYSEEAKYDEKYTSDPNNHPNIMESYESNGKENHGKPHIDSYDEIQNYETGYKDAKHNRYDENEVNSYEIKSYDDNENYEIGYKETENNYYDEKKYSKSIESHDYKDNYKNDYPNVIESYESSGKESHVNPHVDSYDEIQNFETGYKDAKNKRYDENEVDSYEMKSYENYKDHGSYYKNTENNYHEEKNYSEYASLTELYHEQKAMNVVAKPKYHRDEPLTKEHYVPYGYKEHYVPYGYKEHYDPYGYRVQLETY